MSLTSDILAYASSLGFNLAAVIPACPPRSGAAFTAWLAAGYHGEMGYLAASAAERLDPIQLAPAAASMIMLAINYRLTETVQDASDLTKLTPVGRIARYARRLDYHATIKPKLYALDAFIRASTGRATPGKVFVDSAPVLERDFAEQAGLGFIGRNTCLITPGLGSWTFLAGLLVPEQLEAGGWKLALGDALRQANQGCGRCTRCLDACPTRAFVAPHVLDARRCISYLTIELRGVIPPHLRPLMGNWVFGCDVCQEVCPYNRPVSPRVARIDPPTRADDIIDDAVLLPAALALHDILSLDEAGFRSRFRGTPVLRAKRRGLLRNACVAAGNAKDQALAPALLPLLADPEPLVRSHAAWALDQLGAS